MRLFRIRSAVKAFSLFTGAIFMNMSFILAEISALKIDKDKQMARNLSVLVANSFAEEEPGADEDSSLSELDLFSHASHATCERPSFSIRFNIWSHRHPRLAECEICNPPPEA